MHFTPLQIHARPGSRRKQTNGKEHTTRNKGYGTGGATIDRNIVFEIRTKTNQPQYRHTLIGMYSQPKPQIIGRHTAVSPEAVSLEPLRTQAGDKGSDQQRQRTQREGYVSARQRILGTKDQK